MQTYISTLGFHETRVTRPVIKHGLNAGDQVVLVRPESEGNSDRAADAVGYVEDMVEEIEPGATVTREPVDTDEFTTSVLQCSDILLAVDPDRELIVNFGGGAREVLLPLLVASILHAPQVDQAFQYTDVDQEVREFSLPNLATQLPSNAVDTFELLARLDREVTLSELASESDRSKSTVGRHVEALADTEVITTRLDGNTKYVACSQTGRFVHRARETPTAE